MHCFGGMCGTDQISIEPSSALRDLGSRLSCLILYPLTSVSIFSILFSKHFQGADEENLSKNQKLFFVCDQFLYSHDLNI